jgi:hypothetical protein
MDDLRLARYIGRMHSPRQPHPELLSVVFATILRFENLSKRVCAEGRPPSGSDATDDDERTVET